MGAGGRHRTLRAAWTALRLYWAAAWRNLAEVWRWAIELADDAGLRGRPLAESAAVLSSAATPGAPSASPVAGREEALALARAAVARARG